MGNYVQTHDMYITVIKKRKNIFQNLFIYDMGRNSLTSRMSPGECRQKYEIFHKDKSGEY